MEGQRLFSGLLGLHGIYYIATGLWAVIAFDHFSLVVRPDQLPPAFEAHVIAGIVIALGIVYMWASRNKIHQSVFLTASLVAAAFFLVELFFLPTMGWTLLWFDLFEEAIATVFFGYAFIRNK